MGGFGVPLLLSAVLYCLSELHGGGEGALLGGVPRGVCELARCEAVAFPPQLRLEVADGETEEGVDEVQRVFVGEEVLHRHRHQTPRDGKTQHPNTEGETQTRAYA